MSCNWWLTRVVIFWKNFKLHSPPVARAILARFTNRGVNNVVLIINCCPSHEYYTFRTYKQLSFICNYLVLTYLGRETKELTFTTTTLYNNLDQIHHSWFVIAIVTFNPIVNNSLIKTWIKNVAKYNFKTSVSVKWFMHSKECFRSFRPLINAVHRSRRADPEFWPILPELEFIHRWKNWTYLYCKLLVHQRKNLCLSTKK